MKGTDLGKLRSPKPLLREHRERGSHEFTVQCTGAKPDLVRRVAMINPADA